MLNLMLYVIHSIMKPDVTAIDFVSDVLTVVVSCVTLEAETVEVSFLTVYVINF